MSDATLTADDLIALLRGKYPSNEWALVTQVGNGTGFKVNRHADAIAMNLWPSRGLAVLGFEVKVARGDWLRELKAPDKADPIARYCDEWWVVAPEEIVHPGELPLGWGLLAPKAKGLRVVVPAPRRAEAAPLDRDFIAAILRRVDVTQPNGPVVRRLEEEYRAKVDATIVRERERADEQVRERMEDLAAFEAASGVTLDRFSTWRWGNIGEAVKAVLNGKHDEPERRIENLKNIVTRLAEDLGMAVVASSNGDST